MNCAEMNQWLDRLMDGELTAEQKRELEAHGQTCPDCAEQIRAALSMKALFDEMPVEEDVPLAVQADWRNAVRAESKRVKTRRLYRWVGSVAAALVVVAGIGWALNARDIPLQSHSLKAAPIAETAVREAAADTGVTSGEAAYAFEAETPMMDAAEAAEDFAASDAAVIEADGYDEEAETDALGAPMREIRFTVEDVDAACDVIGDLINEYDGDLDAQRSDGGANLYIRLPSENAADFLSAIAHLDLSGASSDASSWPDEGMASLLLILEE